jgi:hypothetical protein
MNKYTNIQYFVFFLALLISVVCKAKTVDIGDTTFSHTLLKVGAGKSSISVFDFNSDGHKDVIISNYLDNNIVIYRGNGKGNLTEISRFAAGENPTDMSVSDINGDGNFDVVIANHETSYVTLLYGDGQGNFKHAPHSPLNIKIKPHPHTIQLKDLDGDNRVDLIVDSRTHKGLRFLKGIGNGNFKTPGEIIDVGGDPYLGFALGDINGDGSIDIVTPNQREIGIILNTNSDKLSFSIKKLGPYESPFAVELAEMNGDGKTDLIVASRRNSITIIPGDGHGNFLEEKKTSIKTSSGAKQIAVGDINGDGIKDALISNWSSNLLIVLGGKTSFETISFEHSSIPNPWGLMLVDLNEDGKSDFIITNGDSDLAALYLSQSK